MKRRWIVIFSALQIAVTGLCLLGFADQNVPLNIQGGGAADLLNVTTTPRDLQDSHRDNNVRFSCNDQYGRTIEKGTPAYDDCMNAASAKAKQMGNAKTNSVGLTTH